MSRRLILRHSSIHGNGVFANTDFAAGIDLIAYRGRLLTHAQADRIYANTSGTGHTFLFTLNDSYLVDANVGGNIARWINHSCAPNCSAGILDSDDGDKRKARIVIESIRPIACGDELTYDYGIVLEEPHTRRMKAIWACRCGAPNCTGTMLSPKLRRGS